MSRQSDYVTTVRNATKQLWEALNTLKGAQREWVALDYASNLTEGFEGENANLTVTDISNVVFTTTDALETLLASGHATNLAKLL